MGYTKIDIYLDGDGHEYLIPEYEWEDFYKLVESLEEAKIYSTEWYELNDELNDRYGKYMEYYHNVDLYMKQEDIDKL